MNFSRISARPVPGCAERAWAPCCRLPLSQWTVHTPEGTFPCVCSRDSYAQNILRQGGPEALAQWRELERLMEPLQSGAALLPAAAMRSDPGACAGLTGSREVGRGLAWQRRVKKGVIVVLGAAWCV